MSKPKFKSKSKSKNKVSFTETEYGYKKRVYKKGRYTRKTKGVIPPQKHGRRDTVITPAKLEFINMYLQVHSIVKAAKALKMAPGTATDWFRTDLVQKEIGKIKEKIREECGFNLEAATLEAEEARQFGFATNNANAVVKATELKTKLYGLLIEKHDHRLAANFQINVQGVRDKRPVDVIDGAKLPPLPQLRGVVEKAVETVITSVVKNKNEDNTLTEEEMSLF